MLTQIDLALETAKTFAKVNDEYDDKGNAKAFRILQSYLEEIKNIYEPEEK